MIRNKAVNDAIDFILLHINEELSVDDIASHCHFSQYYFSRLFRRETGEIVIIIQWRIPFSMQQRASWSPGKSAVRKSGQRYFLTFLCCMSGGLGVTAG